MARDPDKKYQNLIRALTQTTRALSGEAELQVLMDGETVTKKQQGKPMLHLPQFPTRGDPETLEAYKGLANREAFLYRFGAHSHKDINAPAAIVEDVIKPLEAAWTEAHGKRQYKGSAPALEALRAREVNNIVEETAEQSSRRQLGYVLSAGLRQEMDETLLPAEKNLLKQYKKYLTPEVKEWLRDAARHLASPEARKDLYQDLLSILDLARPEEDDPPPEAEAGENQQQEEQAGTSSGDGAAEETPDETAADDGASEAGKEAEASVEESETEQEDQGEQARKGQRPSFGDNSTEYRIFTTKHDVTTLAEKILPEPELERLRTRYRKVTAGTRTTVSKMAVRLQRLLLAQTNLGWRFDQEEGLLDPKKLPQIIVSGDPYPYRRPRSKSERDTVVTLLLDNSGSMRGRPIEMTALSADILTRTLERCGVKTEVLGFTTQTWKGGQSRLDWISEGAPENPGRLNDNLLIVYKDADKSYQAARGAFPVMLADDLLKENIDGESLLWAYSRLIKRPESRKILLVISDGAPVDYATDKHNAANFLDKHLRMVVGGIEQQSKVELLAIGIGHDVRRYYKNAVTIQNPADLSETLVERMVRLFAGEGAASGKKSG